MSAGSRRNGTHKTGHFSRPDHDQSGAAEDGESSPSSQRQERYTARHAATRSKTARRAGKAAPAAAMAATLAAGVAASIMVGGQPGNAKVTTALDLPAGLGQAVQASPGSAAADAVRLAPASPPQSRPATPARPTATARPSATARPTPTAKPSQPAGVTCSGSSSLLPANVTAIVTFLLANGYSRNAAAGIAGNIYQESKGDPESIGSGGGGLIGWTPLPSGFVTGNPAADLRTQLPAILTYNREWSGYIPALNSAASPASAADIYVEDFERAGIPAAGTREASADAVASACGL